MNSNVVLSFVFRRYARFTLLSPLFRLILLSLIGWLFLPQQSQAQTYLTAQDETESTLRFVSAWEPHRAIVLSIPLIPARQDQELMSVLTSLIEMVTEYCDVLVCYPDRERDLLPYFIDLFENNQKIRSHSGKVEWVESEINSIWIRDFGPLFGVEDGGSILLFNNRYANLSEDADALKTKDPRTYSESDWLELKNQEIHARLREESSRTNGYIATGLQYLYEMDVSVEDTGIALQGGDVMYLGKGRFITGESNILLNRLSKKELTRKLQNRFGFTEVCFLPNLPGSAANHLDMNMMVVDESNVLINESPKRNQTQRVYMDYLYERIEKINTYTVHAIQRRFPDVKIHRLPQLPIIPDSPELVTSKLWNLVFNEVGNQIGVVWGNIASRPANDKQRMEVRGMIMKEIAASVGNFDPTDPADFNRVLLHYFGSDFSKEDLLHTDHLTLYRTYSNSLFVRSIDGREVFILPRYKARNEYEVKLVEEMEPQVEAAYMQARPNAEIRWLDVDPIIDRLGAIHCFTSSIPYLGEN